MNKIKYFILANIIFAISAAYYLLANADAFEIVFYGMHVDSLRTGFMAFRLYVALIMLLSLQAFFTEKQKTVVHILNFLFLFLILMGLFNADASQPVVFLNGKNTDISTLWPIVLFQFWSFFSFRVLKIDALKSWVFYLSLIVFLAIPVIVSPPDLLPFDTTQETSYNHSLLMENDTLISSNQSVQFSAFYSFSCGFCLLSLNKITAFAYKHGIKPENVTLIFPDSDYRSDSLFNAHNTLQFKQRFIDPTLFFDIVANTTPLVLVSKNKEVIGAFRYRDFDDKQIVTKIKQ